MLSCSTIPTNNKTNNANQNNDSNGNNNTSPLIENNNLGNQIPLLFNYLNSNDNKNDSVRFMIRELINDLKTAHLIGKKPQPNKLQHWNDIQIPHGTQIVDMGAYGDCLYRCIAYLVYRDKNKFQHVRNEIHSYIHA